MSARLQRRGVDWEDLRFFSELVQAGTVSGAARRLGVEHSTVTRRIESLEATLGFRLFERGPRGWTLAEEGARLASQAALVQEGVRAFEQRAVAAGGLGQAVRVSAPPALAAHYLAPRLPALLDAHAGLRLEIVAETRQADLLQREADIAIRIGRPSAPTLAARPLGPVAYAFYAHPSILAEPPANWRFLGYDEALRHVPQQRELEAFADGRPFVLRSDDLTLLLNAARGGLGVVALPCFMGEEDPALRRIEPVMPPPREAWLVLHPELRRAPRVRSVADALVALFAADATRLAPAR